MVIYVVSVESIQSYWNAFCMNSKENRIRKDMQDVQDRFLRKSWQKGCCHS